jgi:hypothetical protein
MTHLSMEAVLALRERGSEPGNAVSWGHLQECPQCQGEVDRLHQRVAQLKALPTLRPARDNWPVVAAKLRAERRRRSLQGAALAGLALAASLTIAVVTSRSDTDTSAPGASVAQAERIHQVQERSRQLEHALSSYEPEKRVLDGPTAGVAQAVQDRIAQVDQAIEAAERAEQGGREDHVLQLWQERVEWLDVLVNVHVNRASRVEF